MQPGATVPSVAISHGTNANVIRKWLPLFNARNWHKGLYDNQPKGLKQTVEAMGLAWQGTYHRGIKGARNVASIVKEMLG